MLHGKEDDDGKPKPLFAISWAIHRENRFMV